MIFLFARQGTTFQLRNQDFPYIYAIKILKKREIYLPNPPFLTLYIGEMSYICKVV